MIDGVPAPAFTTLDRDGYLTLPGTVPGEWLAPLREAFEGGVVPSDQWPAPRGQGWRHAQVDQDPLVRQCCRLPPLIAAGGHMLRQPFFLAQVEGRDPRQGNAAQPLHRDAAGLAGQVAAALIWLDPYDAANGATRIIPGSHLDQSASETAQDSAAMLIAGEAGDILLFHPDLLHGATTNHSGTPRRSLLLTYAITPLREQFAQTAALRGVTMDNSESFAAP